jgi:hypothetical protein
MSKFNVGDVIRVKSNTKQTKPRYLILKAGHVHPRAGKVYLLWDLTRMRRTGFQEDIIDRTFQLVEDHS